VASLSLLLGSLGADEAARVVASTADLSLFVVLLPMVSRARLDIVEGEMLEKDYLEKLHDSGALLEFCFIHDRSSLNVPAEVLSLLAGKLDAKGLKRLSYSILSSRTVYATRRLILELNKAGIDAPVVVRYRNEGSDRSQILIDSAVQAGTLFCDGIGDIIALQTALSPDDETALAFNILQAARTRMSKTEFISCPGCGRTYFDLESSTKLIKQRIAHLKGLKIGIMGCVVNGPGEMADADFGYVGSGKGHISLYVGKECVEENIEESSALDRLIELIKVNGKWVEPVSAETAPRS
jgi:(E)-4-hydroxy-3-methylbut-2-enyl-diphosphate synthase